MVDAREGVRQKGPTAGLLAVYSPRQVVLHLH